MDKTKKKVLAVSCNGLGNGGVQSVIMEILRNCSDEYTFDILLFTNQIRHHEKEFLSYGGKIFRIPNKSGRILSAIDSYLGPFGQYKKILNILKTQGPYAAVHCHNFLDAAIVIRAAKKAGVPVRIAHAHMAHMGSNFIRRLYEKAYIKILHHDATHLIGCSQEACDIIFGRDADTQIVNNPYNSERFSPDKYQKEMLSTPVLTQIGWFSETKNQLFSVEVLSHIVKQYSDAKLNLIGFDYQNFSQQILNKAKELGIENNVIFHPSDADSPKILSESSGFIFPSKAEGFGIVAIEAQAMGVRCYVSDTVPKTTNCGGCEYLPLSAGAEYWAEKIIADFKMTGGKQERYDCSAFASYEVAKQYKNIYGGIQS